MACALWAKPDVLVMDEPTNHVDASTRETICAAPGSFKGIGLLVSHDRELLDMLCSRCLFVSNGSVIAQLNSEPERILEGREVSPGEMRKLMLALDVLAKPELIIMDEPTNHLDLGSIEALERLLGSYPGALLLVSHDAGLVRAVTNITWTIGGECRRVQALAELADC